MLQENIIIQGDCLIKLKELEDNSVDSIVTDPPYELGFMGKSWDNTGIANNKEMWAECLRVLKPGGHLLAFSGTRTYHRMACAIEDAGFEVRDMIEWVYGSGFPKSRNIGLDVDKRNGVTKNRGKAFVVAGQSGQRDKDTGGDLVPGSNTMGAYVSQNEWNGWGTALKPAHEPICMARKPLAEKTVAENVLKYGTGGINIDESRVGTEERFNAFAGNKDTGFTADDNRTDAGKGLYAGNKEGGTTVTGRFPANLLHDNSEEVRECFPETGKAGNVRETDGITAGNSIFGIGDLGKRNPKISGDNGGNASRFFKSIIYQAKASKSERNKGLDGLEEKIDRPFEERLLAQCKICGNKGLKVGAGKQLTCGHTEIEYVKTEYKPSSNNHPTVKPIALMEYLIKMVTPKGGVVLDPFAGSGSTLVAAKQNGFQYIGIEMTEEYIPIIEARLKNAVKENTLF